jgi:hypothetical protein
VLILEPVRPATSPIDANDPWSHSGAMGRRMDFVEPGQLSVLLEIVGAATVVGAFLTGTCRLMPESPQRHGISNRPARVRRGKPDREELWAAFRLQFGVVGGRSRARVLGEALVLRRRRSCGCRRPDD